MIAANPDTSKVLIVGAGIGGLALAQILRRQNVPYEIFERDDGLSSRKQGWAIALIEYVVSFSCHPTGHLSFVAGTLASLLPSHGPPTCHRLTLLVQMFARPGRTPPR